MAVPRSQNILSLRRKRRADVAIKKHPDSDQDFTHFLEFPTINDSVDSVSVTFFRFGLAKPAISSYFIENECLPSQDNPNSTLWIFGGSLSGRQTGTVAFEVAKTSTFETLGKFTESSLLTITIGSASRPISSLFMNDANDDEMGIRVTPPNLVYFANDASRWFGSGILDKPIGDFAIGSH